MSTYWVYILECKDGTLYTGIATDVERRFNEHKEGKGSRYTRSRGVKRLMHSERAGSRSEALIREAAIKKLPRSEKIALARNSG